MTERQRYQTVNLGPSGFPGSSPGAPTILKGGDRRGEETSAAGTAGTEAEPIRQKAFQGVLIVVTGAVRHGWHSTHWRYNQPCLISGRSWLVLQ